VRFLSPFLPFLLFLTDHSFSLPPTTACGSYAHAKCAGYLTNGCHPGGHHSSSQPDDTLNFTPSGPPMFGNDLVTQATAEGRDIPIVVSKCIDAVEAYGASSLSSVLPQSPSCEERN
jgi:hypothetical protein